MLVVFLIPFSSSDVSTVDFLWLEARWVFGGVPLDLSLGIVNDVRKCDLPPLQLFVAHATGKGGRVDVTRREKVLALGWAPEHSVHLMHKYHKAETRWVSPVWSHYEKKGIATESPLRWIAITSVTPQITCLGFFIDMNLQVCALNGKALSLAFLRVYFWIKDHTQTDTFFLFYFTMRYGPRYSLLAALITCLLSLTRRKHHEWIIYISASSLFKGFT